MRLILLSAFYFFLLSQKSIILSCMSEFAETSFASIVKDFSYNWASCYDIFLPSSISDSLNELKYSISGQPFVKNTLIPTLVKHYRTDVFKGTYPNKPLVLRFHGPIGVGKTFVADHLLKSNYFRNKHIFHLSELAGKSSLESYKKKIEWKIEFSLKNCKRSIFVFDDVSAVPQDFFNNLPPFKKYYPHSKHPNFNESLFIFISQDDSDAISETTTKYLKEGRSRDSLEISEFLTSMKNEFFSSGSFIKSMWDKIVGYWDINTDSKDVLDLYIPFLPLEPIHVKKCIENNVGAAKLRSHKHLLENVLYAIHCTPDHKFCPYGCKLVHAKTSMVLDNHDEF